MFFERKTLSSEILVGPDLKKVTKMPLNGGPTRRKWVGGGANHVVFDEGTNGCVHIYKWFLTTWHFFFEKCTVHTLHTPMHRGCAPSWRAMHGSHT